MNSVSGFFPGECREGLAIVPTQAEPFRTEPEIAILVFESAHGGIVDKTILLREIPDRLPVIPPNPVVLRGEPEIAVRVLQKTGYASTVQRLRGGMVREGLAIIDADTLVRTEQVASFLVLDDGAHLVAAQTVRRGEVDEGRSVEAIGSFAVDAEPEISILVLQCTHDSTGTDALRPYDGRSGDLRRVSGWTRLDLSIAGSDDEKKDHRAKDVPPCIPNDRV